MQAQAAAAAVQAVCEYDATLGVPLGAYVRSRIMAGALTRSRQEWRYGLRYGADADPPVRSIEDAPPSGVVQESVRGELNQLPDSDRLLIERLYWDGWTEAEVAAELGISQPAVNKRKRAILDKLRLRLNAPEK